MARPSIDRTYRTYVQREKQQRVEARALLKNVRWQLAAQHELISINSRESDALAAIVSEVGMWLDWLGEEWRYTESIR